MKNKIIMDEEDVYDSYKHLQYNEGYIDGLKKSLKIIEMYHGSSKEYTQRLILEELRLKKIKKK